MYWGELSKYRNQIYGISILWIVIYHVYEAFFDKLNFNWLSSLIFNSGNIGVDIFLFLSGISMHYSMKRYENLCFSNILDFYKRRFGKILKVYLIFCVPFLILRDVIFGHNIDRFIKQVLFFDNDVSSFWFLMAIMICYLIYPLLEKLLRMHQNKIIIGIIVVYIAILFGAKHYYASYFNLYEILLTRIPIFIIGTLFSERVRNNKKISLKEFSFFIAIILLKSPFVYAVSRISVISELAPVVARLLMGWMGIGIIFVMIMFIKVYEHSRVDRVVSKIGTFTLEVYVFHIALRRVLLYLLPMVGIDLVAYRQIIPFGLVYVPLSIFGGYILSLIVNRIK